MPFRLPFLLNASFSISAVAAPLAIISASTPGLAETVEPSAPVPVIAAPAPVIQVPTIQAAPAPAPAEPTIAADSSDSVDQQQAECVAKVILHEAAYEPRAGRIAVAQVIHARIKDGRFARNACAVTRQRGQFFDIDAFNPSRNANWHDAVAIARDVLSEQTAPVAPGALFFHTAYSPMPGHARVTQIGGHVFYR